jgi:hypothetical protein
VTDTRSSANHHAFLNIPELTKYSIFLAAAFSSALVGLEVPWLFAKGSKAGLNKTESLLVTNDVDAVRWIVRREDVIARAS